MFQYKYGWERMKGFHSQSAGIYRAAMRILAESGAQIVIRWCVGQLSGSFDMLRGHHQVTSCWTAIHIRGIRLVVYQYYIRFIHKNEDNFYFSRCVGRVVLKGLGFCSVEADQTWQIFSSNEYSLRIQSS